MNNPIHKHLMILALLILTISPQLEAQYLNVPLIGQRNSQWCWAASMEMVFQFYNKNIQSQCGLAQELVELKHGTNSFFPHSGIHPSNSCNSVCDNLSPNSIYNKPIPFSKRDSKLDFQFIDMLFANNGYYSIESIETTSMDIGAIETEIQSCRPFLIFLNKLDKGIRSTPYPHVVAAKGTHKLLGADFVLVNDPQKDAPANCKGCELLLPVDIFSANVRELNSALEVASHIFPIDEPACDNCDKKPVVATTELIDAVIGHSSLFTAIGTTHFNNLDFDTLKGLVSGSDPLFVETPFFYYDIVTSTQKDVTGLVSNLTSPKLAFLFEEIGGIWKLKEISKANCTAFDTVIQARPPNADSEVMYFTSGEFEIIEFLPNNYVFYRVSYKESSYLIPAYEYVGLPFKVEQMYREKSVINYLKKVQRRNNSNRRLKGLNKNAKKGF